MLYTLKEHKNKKLVPNEIEETTKVVSNLQQENLKTLEESAKGKSKRKLIVQMEAIHVGKTKNSTFYTEEGLKGGLSSWTQPYNKPVLTHHNSHSGEAIGRILKAEYSNKTLSGKDGLLFTVEITDPDAIEKVLDGRYQTVSIGASTDKVTCNICGTDRTEEWCEHYPGKTYEDQTCHFIIGTTYGREVSYVNTPSDEHAGNRSIQIVDEDGKTEEKVNMQIYQMAEGLYQDASNPELNIYEHLNDDVKAMLDLMTVTEEKGEKSMPPKEEEVNEEVEEKEESEEEIEESLDEKNKESKEDVKESEVEEDNLQELFNNVVAENMKLKNQLQEAESENKELVQENARLIEEAHIALVEKIVDLKRSLNKQDVIAVDREEAIATHMKRTKESLNDTLQDLLAESKTEKKVQPGSVQNPGVSEVQETEGKSNRISIEEGVKLMTGMFNRTKK